MTSVLTAVTHRLEAEFVRVIEGADDVTLVRRCADVEELLSAGAAGVARVAVVSPDLRGLDRDALRHLAGHGVRVAGLVATDDDEGERRLRQLGVATILRPSDDAATAAHALVALAGATTSAMPVHDPPVRGGVSPAAGAGADGGSPAGDAHRTPTRPSQPRSPRSGARPVPRAARPSRSPSLPSSPPPGCAPCSSTSTRGAPAWPRCSAWSTRHRAWPRRPAPPSRAPSTCPGWPGSRPRWCPACGCSPGCRGPTGWPELRAAAVEDVLRLARGVADHVVVDTGFAVEDDEELSYDTAAPRRNAATLTALEASDHLVVVGAADPVGLQRLVRAVQDVAVLPSPRPTIVVTKVRASVAGRRPERAIGDVLRRFAGMDAVRFLPWAPDECDAALLAGRSLVEVAPRADLTVAVAELAATLDPRVPAPSASGRRTASRVGRRVRGDDGVRPRHRVTLTRPTV